ncbi:MAG: hypothetical protein KIT83_08470 [Bryobacterales bacterium]|nr:hypothetical protein [Bryobacterales bacterium]
MNYLRRSYARNLIFVLAGLLLLGGCSRRGGAGKDFIPTAVTAPASSDPSPEQTLADYYTAQRTAERLRDFRVDVQIEASLPAMNKQGGMTATRVQRGTDTLSYAGAQFSGDEMIKRDVITRYLNAEKEALRNPPDVLMLPRNYRFEYRGVAMHLDRRAHVFEVIPREGRIGLFRGELWIDMETAQPLREFGRLVRNPSVFLKDVDFVRDYRIIDGRALPSRFISNMDTRLVGPAAITVTLNNYEFAGQTP